MLAHSLLLRVPNGQLYRSRSLNGSGASHLLSEKQELSSLPEVASSVDRDGFWRSWLLVSILLYGSRLLMVGVSGVRWEESRAEEEACLIEFYEV